MMALKNNNNPPKAEKNKKHENQHDALFSSVIIIISQRMARNDYLAHRRDSRERQREYGQTQTVNESIFHYFGLLKHNNVAS